MPKDARRFVRVRVSKILPDCINKIILASPRIRLVQFWAGMQRKGIFDIGSHSTFWDPTVITQKQA